MLFTGLALIAAASIAALAYWPLARREPSAARSALKTLSVSALALAALLNAAPPLLIAALALGSLGDFALSRRGERAFFIGLISFALGHLALVALLMAQPGSTLTLLTGPHLALALGMGVFALGIGWVLVPHAGALAVPVAGYVAIILAMGLAALSLSPGLALGAALLFMASDAVLGVEMFRLSDGHPARAVTSAAIWPLYWLAQLGFLLALG